VTCVVNRRRRSRFTLTRSKPRATDGSPGTDERRLSVISALPTRVPEFEIRPPTSKVSPIAMLAGGSETFFTASRGRSAALAAPAPSSARSAATAHTRFTLR
jgi:hypothetical protein